jgi:uncharacterized protein GlcG (DUF336 family)
MRLEHAATIVDAALAEGRSRKLAPLCVVVLDAGGHAVALKREDRAGISRPQLALAKAAGCLGMGFGGRELARRAQATPVFYGALASVFPNGILTVAGGVLVRDASGNLIGAVGVTGDTSDNDELCALAGIAAAGLIAETGAES